MSVQVRAGATTDLLTVDPTSKAARVTLYDSAGAEIVVVNTIETDPRGGLVYTSNGIDVAGQTAAYNFWALSNPAASGKHIALLHVNYQCYSVAAVATKNSWGLVHCTAEASGGADDSANIYRVVSSQAAPIGVVRITNPTITAGKLIHPFAASGNITAAAGYGVTFIFQDFTLPDSQPIILPGEGCALRQTVAGDVDQTYCWNVIWREYTP